MSWSPLMGVKGLTLMRILKHTKGRIKNWILGVEGLKLCLIPAGQKIYLGWSPHPPQTSPLRVEFYALISSLQST